MKWSAPRHVYANVNGNFGSQYIVIQTLFVARLKHGAPTETHTNEYEKFLIVEGSCDLTIGTTVHHLNAGNYLSIPLYVSHDVKVTSAIPCKIILQRVNA